MLKIAVYIFSLLLLLVGIAMLFQPENRDAAWLPITAVILLPIIMYMIHVLENRAFVAGVKIGEKLFNKNLSGNTVLNADDKLGIGYMMLCMMPIIGIIVFLANRGKYPNKATMAIKATGFGFLFFFVLSWAISKFGGK